MISFNLLMAPGGMGMLLSSSSDRGGTEALWLCSLTEVVQPVQGQSQNCVCLLRAHVWSVSLLFLVESLVLMCCWAVHIFSLFPNWIVAYLKSDIVIRSSCCFQKYLACRSLKIKVYWLTWTLSLKLTDLRSPFLPFGGLGGCCMNEGWRTKVFLILQVFFKEVSSFLTIIIQTSPYLR